MVFVFVFGVVAAFVAPFLRRFGNVRSVCLAAGAAVLVLFAVVGLTHPDPSHGLAAVDANQREYLFVLACESPVLALGFFPCRGLRNYSFLWLGWGIHTSFTACVLTVVVWLKFFWHW
jgi:hypothetical protein